ncbi:uncharacterized protein LOC111024593 [Momordica charantia]|uniref:Uncharacterized protein LOC111024593 n=1 Tax=Momordica charantia TaxID=3673 RepID=A0A6J1DZQ9_MOMCH|nr:uncharacterized protein LOC111024593 [Momordica charantia]
MIDTVNDDHKQASNWVVANLIKDRVAGTGRIYKIKHIKEDVRKEFGVNISYDKAHRARELASAIVRGRPEDSYMHLHAYNEAIKIENPCAIFHIETEGSLNFKYLFMALGASIRGFQPITRRVIMVDGTHLKGKFRGVILIGVAMDGNNQIYPLAFGIVDNESDASWKWFMKNLKDMIGHPPELVFISDRHDATYVYRKSQFTYYWNQILSVGSGSLAKYLQEIGVERWARCYQVGRRYENMTTNSAESFEKSHRYTVKSVDWCMFHVEDGGLDGKADLNARTCTCMEFQYMGIPCSHAIAVARHKNINCHTLIDPCYSVDSLIGAYAEPILPVGHMSEWKRPVDYQPIPIQPPELVKHAGRRRTQQITSTGERRVVNKCS